MSFLKEFLTPFSRNFLIIPSLRAHSFVRCYVARDVCVASNRALISYFPATPYFGVVWTLRGSRRMLIGGSKVAEDWIDHRVRFFGARSFPLQFEDSASLSVFYVFFQPDALGIMLGWDASLHYEREGDALKIFPPEWCEVFEDVFNQSTHQNRIELIENFLQKKWQKSCGELTRLQRPAGHWLENIVLRAAISRPGTSARQIARRMRRLTGTNLRSLATLNRAEKTLTYVREIVELGGGVSWSQLSSQLGFYDQSHLCNEIKRLSGLTPEQLRAMALRRDDSLWFYWLWT